MGIMVVHGTSGSKGGRPMQRSLPVKPFGMPITPFDPMTGKHLPLSNWDAILVVRIGEAIEHEARGKAYRLQWDGAEFKEPGDRLDVINLGEALAVNNVVLAYRVGQYVFVYTKRTMVAGDTVPVITSEAGSVGVAPSTFIRDDTIPGLLLRKNGTAQDISGFMFGSANSGAQLRIAAAADEDAERAATVHDYPTIEIVPVDGVAKAGTQVKLDPAGAVIVGLDGLQVNYGDGLDIVANTLVATGGSPLSVGAKQEFFRTDDHTTNGFVWKLLDGRTIGSAASGATWASADAEALFVFLWDHVTDTYCPVSGGRGASAAADWAANKTLTIPDSRGDASGPRYAAGAGGAGPAVGQTGGDATLQPGLTVAADLAGVETDTGVANITANNEEMIRTGTEDIYIRPYDAGHKHPVTDIASALSSSTTAEFNVRPRYLAAGMFILAKVPS